MNARFTTGLLAAAAVGATFVPATATAATTAFADTVGDIAHGGDIETVTVKHGQRLKVTIDHVDLVADFTSGTSGAVYVDTNPERHGPELVFVAGLFEGTDYQLMKARDWKPVGQPLSCSHDLRLDFDNDLSVFKFSRGCLGDTDSVRVAAKVGGETEDGVVRDWLVGVRHLTDEVAKG